jgi:predicted amidophosphoribosyltransferase
MEVRYLLATSGSCNFCDEKWPHAHPMCPSCGTVGFRNTVGCATCREAMAKKKAALIEAPVNN